MHLTPTKRARIVRARRAGERVTDLALEFKCNPSTITRTTQLYDETGDFYKKRPKKGRPRKLDDRDVRFAVRKLDFTVVRDATDLQRQFFPDVAPTTIRKYMREAGLYGRIRRQVPLIIKPVASLRYRWARMVRSWTRENWNDVAFSDESKFCLFGSNGPKYCRRRKGAALDPRYTEKRVQGGGGHLFVWGMITSKGPGRLIRVEGTLTAMKLIEIYKTAYIPSLYALSLSPTDTIFQQDNDPKHTANVTWAWIEDNNIPMMPWPSHSPDMNPIEHCWDELDRRLRRRSPPPTNIDQLFDMLCEEWARLSMDYIAHLYDSMTSRVEALYQARGWNTSY